MAATGTGAARVYTPNGLLPARAAVAVERALGPLTDAFVAVSETEAQRARRLRLARPERVTVIPNGIEVEQSDPASLDLRAELGLDPSTPLVGTVGRLSPQKAPEVFVRACAMVNRELPEARFVLIGDGPLAPVIDREVATAGLGGRFCHLRGLLGATTVMSQFDVFALASRYEGGPYAPLEAMRAGTPVVLTNVVGNRDTVEDGRSGILVPPDDPGALAAAMLRVLSDEHLRKKLAEAGQARISTRFDVRMMAGRLTALYQSFANKKPGCATL
jgi:glycosyltransferase involved in cell wall biosynthesis